MTCLHYAVWGGSLPVIRYLMYQCGFDLSLMKCDELLPNDTTHCLIQYRVCLCSTCDACGNIICNGTSVHVATVTLQNVLCTCAACFCPKVMSCLPTFLQYGLDCFLLACLEGHQEIVRELLTKDKVDQNVVDKVRN